MADARRKDAIWTYSGKVIRPLDPSPNDICIEDVAHALANQCRFTGHTRTFYSVAEHSVLVSKAVPDEMALSGLLHDASEAYLADMARPVKYAEPFASVYHAAEERLMYACAEAFGFEWPMLPEVKAADDAVLHAEILALMPEGFPTAKFTPMEWITPAMIQGLRPHKAEEAFLEVYERIGRVTV